MGLFGRRKQAPDAWPAIDMAIASFWQWWSTSASVIADSIPAGRLEQYADIITGHVQAIHTGLVWEFGPGKTSEHQLTVTAEGDPTLRRVARKWLRGAPSPDAIWSFHDMRQASPLDSVLSIGDASIAFADVLVNGTRRGNGLDVVVYHPLFSSLPAEAQAQIAFLSLDAVLGEEAVELWIGTIDPAVAAPHGSRPLAELPKLVAETVADAMPEGEMGWSMLRGGGPRGPVLVMCLNRLASVQAPHHDEHVAVTVPFRDVTADGWPGPGSLDRLRAFEDHLGDLVRGSGQLVAVETSGGVRTLHFYVDSTTPAGAQLQAGTAGWDQGSITVTAQTDPSWDAVKAFRD